MPTAARLSAGVPIVGQREVNGRLKIEPCARATVLFATILQMAGLAPGRARGGCRPWPRNWS